LIKVGKTAKLVTRTPPPLLLEDVPAKVKEDSTGEPANTTIPLPVQLTIVKPDTLTSPVVLIERAATGSPRQFSELDELYALIATLRVTTAPNGTLASRTTIDCATPVNASCKLLTGDVYEPRTLVPQRTQRTYRRDREPTS
jgi:hypothetical protein